MRNILFIEGCAYTDLKKALGQWLDISSETLTPELSFELYKNGKGKYIIKADEELENEQFNYLLNYLKYPEEIKYIIKITGFTTIIEPTVFPAERIGEDVLIFIPESDKEYDNVYWVTTGNKVYKTDFGSKTVKTEISKTYEKQEFNPEEFPPPEILYSKHIDNIVEPEEKESNIGKRFKIISIIIGTFILVGLFFYNNPPAFLTINKIIGFGTAAWFFTDYKMLRINKYYNLSILVSIIIAFYSYLVRQSHPFYKFVGNLEFMLMLPLLFLITQKPLRMGFKSIMKREPVLEKPLPSFVDFIYIVLLFVFIFLMAQLIPATAI